jgi:hypothetical protein
MKKKHAKHVTAATSSIHNMATSLDRVALLTSSGGLDEIQNTFSLSKTTNLIRLPRSDDPSAKFRQTVLRNVFTSVPYQVNACSNDSSCLILYAKTFPSFSLSSGSGTYRDDSQSKSMHIDSSTLAMSKMDCRFDSTYIQCGSTLIRFDISWTKCATTILTGFT